MPESPQSPASPTSDIAPRSRLATLRYPRPRCPVCGHIHLLKYRSLRDQGDGTALSWVRCARQSCGHKFRVLLE